MPTMTDGLAERLLIRPGVTLWFQPIEWLHLLGPLPTGVRMGTAFAGSTVVVEFVSNAGAVRGLMNRYRAVIPLPPVVWICYPARGRTDFNRPLLLQMIPSHGLRPVEDVPIDANWSAMRVRTFAPG
jgi:hypothetical protein